MPKTVKPKSKYGYRIPFAHQQERGAVMLEWTRVEEGTVTKDVVEWRDNVSFDAIVHLSGHGRGRSSARIYVTDEHSWDRYSMGIAAFYEAVRVFGVVLGSISGRWTFRKQGQNYTLWPEPGEV